MAGMATNAGVFNTFDRMKRKVDDQEARAAAAQEIAEETGDTKLEKQFAELGKSSIDDELAKLKTQVSDAPKAGDPELAKLKEEIKK